MIRKSCILTLVLLCTQYSYPALNITFGTVNSLETIANGQPEEQLFNDLIQNHTVVVDFFAPWCGPCKAMNPILHDLAKEFPNVVFVKINVDMFKKISSRYGIQSIPQLFLYKNGGLQKRLMGGQSKAQLRSAIQANLA